MRRSTSIATAVMVSAFAAALPAAGQLVVDDFSTNHSVAHSTINTSTTSEIAGAGLLGGVRTIRLTQGASSGFLTGTVASNTLVMSTTTLGDLEVWWDGVDDDGFTPTGLGGMDLTNGGSRDRFRLQVLANDRPTELMRMQIWMTGADLCEAQFQMPTGTLEVLFSAFTSCTGTATTATAPQAAGAVFFRTVNRPGAWSFTLGSVEGAPVELVSFTVD